MLRTEILRTAELSRFRKHLIPRDPKGLLRKYGGKALGWIPGVDILSDIGLGLYERSQLDQQLNDLETDLNRARGSAEAECRSPKQRRPAGMVGTLTRALSDKMHLLVSRAA